MILSQEANENDSQSAVGVARAIIILLFIILLFIIYYFRLTTQEH